MWLKNNGLYVTKGRNVKIWGDLEGKEKYECIRSIRKSHNPKVTSSSLVPATKNLTRVARDCGSLIFLLKIYFYKSGDNLGTVPTFLYIK